MKKILILGKQSPLALAIYELILKETDWKIYLELDNYKSSVINDKLSFQVIQYDKKVLRKIILDIAPNYIINCLSLDDFQLNEDNKKESWDYNVGTIEALSKGAFMTESKLIFFSTDNIFDGNSGPYNEDDLANPINYYGKTKLGSENYCISNNVQFVSIRIPEYYGNNNSTGTNIFYKIINDNKIELATNIFTSPVLLDDIALGVLKIIDKNKLGIYNFAGLDYISEYDYGMMIKEYLSLNKVEIFSYSYDSKKSKTKKLVRGGLINLKSEIELNMKFVGLHSGLTTVRFQINYNN